MSGSVPAWSVAVQFAVAGVVLGLVAVQTGWLTYGSARRPGGRRALIAWMSAWTVALLVLSVVNGLLGLVSDPAWTPVLLALRFTALAASVVLGIPAIRAFLDSAPVRGMVPAVGVWYAVATVLWLGTDLVHRPGPADGLAQDGPLAALVHLVPVTAIALHTLSVVRRTPVTPTGVVVVASGLVSGGLLISASVAPPTVLSELLLGTWSVPLVIGLQVLATRRVIAARRADARRSKMRDALGSIAYEAWHTPEPSALLEQARDQARVVLADESVVAELRSQAQDSFTAHLTSPRTLDADAQGFLVELGRLVSTAAERHALTGRLRRAAYQDSLTGLPNRPALDEHLVQVLGAAASVALMLVDVEGLKHTNERLGHRAGDDLLVRTAEHLVTSLAQAEGRPVYVARVGGDEFAAVLVGGHSTDRLRALARAVRDGFGEDGTEVSNLTVGVAHASSGCPVTLQRNADRAMAEARRTHSGVAYFDDRLREREAELAAVTADLEKAVDAGRIVAHFQPVVDPVSLEVVGLEVLARWQDGEVLRSPGSWLPLAEESGLIVEVGKRMFAAARQGMERSGLPVAVNMAARQLDEPDVVRHIEESWGTDAWDRLTIEVTESAVSHDLQHVRSALTELADRGARIALDDFGSGYNSLARIGSLPLHVLKIDKSLIDDTTSPEGVAVLQAVVALAGAHGLEVIAEGVEQRQQLTALIELGVDLVQGNLVGRPQADPRARASSTPSQRLGPVRPAAIA